MKRFYLIRHGDKEHYPGDPGLTEKGQEQAEKTGQYLRQFPITHILSSPKLRTQQTAKAIAKNLQISVETHPALLERMNWGDIPQQSLSEFYQMWQTLTWDRDKESPQGDSSRKTGQRIEQLLRDFTQSPHEHIALVSHGGAISDFLRNIFTDEELHSLIAEFPDGRGFDIRECSLTILDFDGQTFSLVTLADCTHL